jgi:hypothetical protein
LISNYKVGFDSTGQSKTKNQFPKALMAKRDENKT